MSAGLSEQTPIALIRWGTRPEQLELVGSLGSIVEQVETTGFQAPAIAVIGKVVDLKTHLALVSPIQGEHWHATQLQAATEQKS